MKHLICVIAWISCIRIDVSVAQMLPAQKISISPKEYNRLKAEGKLDPAATYLIDLKKVAKAFVPTVTQNTERHVYNPNSILSVCDTFLGCNSTSTLIPGIDVPNDDFAGDEIILPFTVCFYGTNYTSVYINNNGNFSFGAGFGTFTPVGFPTILATMIAPFWADVDTRIPTSGTASNLPCMEISNTHITAVWDHVDYYSTQAIGHQILFNTFKCTVTDGNDPILPPGSNVGFEYGDMSWTTGNASMGVNGFGGSAATVGANAGNGVDFIQFGRFDQPGLSYDGPYGANDGVDFLDNRTFVFNTCVSGTFNIPPIFSGSSICDTLEVCQGEVINLNYYFLPGESNQVTTPSFNNNGFPNFQVTSMVTGPSGLLSLQFNPNASNSGLNRITVSATDNGAVPATSTFDILINVNTFNLPLPVLTGPNFYCQGNPGVTLQVPNIYYGYTWNDSLTAVNSRNVLTGTYNIEVEDNHGCKAKSPAFPVWEITLNPVIGGITALCGQDSAHLQTTNLFPHYQWMENGIPTGDTSSTLTVGTGIFSVTVSDQHGCVATSPPDTIQVHPYPTVSFSNTPLTGLPDDTIHFTDLSTPGSGSIISWHWDFGDGTTSGFPNPTHVYGVAGTFPVSLTVTQSDGCSRTYSLSYTAESNEVFPVNIFTPDNDGKNDVFKFRNLEFFPGSKLEVFNRWGKKIFESNDYDNKWNGGDFPEGVYYFILRIPSKDAIKGTVNIKR